MPAHERTIKIRPLVENSMLCLLVVGIADSHVLLVENGSLSCRAVLFPGVVDGNVAYNSFIHVPNIVAGNAIVAYTANITLDKQDAIIIPCNYQEQEGIYTLDSDLQSISYTDGKSSPFTYDFSKAYDIIPMVEAIDNVLSSTNTGDLEIYDTMGRRLSNMKKGQIYIINRKKAFIK